MKMKFFLKAIYFLSFYYTTLGNGEDEYNMISGIRDKVFKTYDRSSRPVKDHSRNTTVKFEMSINDVNLDEEHQRIILNTYCSLSWTDEFLTWDPEDYGGVKLIQVDEKEIWIPDFTLFNSADAHNTKLRSDLPLILYSTGTVLWVPPYLAMAPCPMDFTKWPSDVHECLLHLGSWTHHSEQIEMVVGNKSVNLDHYEENKKWGIVSYSAENQVLPYEGEVYKFVSVSLVVQRQAASHVQYITKATVVVMIMILASYVLPLRFTLCRLLLHLFSIVILVILNTFLFFSLPPTGGGTPLLIRYFSGTIILTTISLLCNILIATLLSCRFVWKENIRSTLASAFSFQQVSLQEYEIREMDYTRLSHEMAEELGSKPEETVNATSATRGQKVFRRFLPILNYFFFFIFILAYIIDYAALRSALRP